MKHLALIFILLGSIGEARAGYLNFTQWSQLPSNERSSYIAGAWDSYEAFVGFTYPQITAHYRNCVVSHSAGSLSEAILQFGKQRPELHRHTAAGAMLDYLIAACGVAPQEKPRLSE